VTGTLWGLALGGLASLCWGVADFIARNAVRKVAEDYALWVVLGVGAVGVAVWAVPRGPVVPGGGDAVLVAVTALFALGGYLALYRAFRVGMLSVVSPIAAGNAVIPVVLALIVLGERPLPWQGAGIVMVLAGVVLLSIRGGVPLPEHTGRLGVAPALLCLVLFGTALFCMKLSVDRVRPDAVALAVRVIGAGVLGVWLLARGRLTPPPREVRLPLLAAGILDAAALLFFCEALTRTLLSLVAPIASTIPVVTVALARIFLHERLSVPQKGGLVLAVFGVALVAVT
jgi:drug/metabolite transporter (DMT)-like permease